MQVFGNYYYCLNGNHIWPTLFVNVEKFAKLDTNAQLIKNFGYFVFVCFCHFGCMIFFTFFRFACLALLSKKVNNLLHNNLVTSSPKQPKTKLPKWDEKLKRRKITETVVKRTDLGFVCRTRPDVNTP